jgi:bifunctional non-homologous end joining protein LigD
LHEIKYDGYRIIARKDGQRVRMWSRNGLSWTASFPLIAEGLRALPVGMAVQVRR